MDNVKMDLRKTVGEYENCVNCLRIDFSGGLLCDKEFTGVGTA
jgi:hypothetical protein